MLGELEKLEANLGGVADMRKQPDAVFIVDLRKEQLAVREARRLGLPVVALVDTNCDPDEADFVIPGQRRRDPLVQPDRPRDRRRHRRRPDRRHRRGVRAAERQRQRRAPEAEARRGGARAARPSRRAEPEARPVRAGRRGGRRGARARGALAGRGDRRAGRARGAEAAAETEAERRSARSRRDRDLGGTRQGAPRPDRRGDDGLQARARRDRRRHRGRAEAPARARARPGAPSAPAATTTEGKVGYTVADDGKKGTMVAVGCETEPVSNNDEFLAFAEKVLEARRRRGQGRRRAARGRARRARRQARREHRDRRAPRASRPSTAGSIDGYAHPPANKLGTLVQLRGGDAGARPLRRDAHRRGRAAVGDARGRSRGHRHRRARDLRELGRGAVEARAGAREDRRGDARTSASSPRRCSTEQPWIHDTGKTVGQALSEEGAEVLEFERFALAG